MEMRNNGRSEQARRLGPQELERCDKPVDDMDDTYMNMEVIINTKKQYIKQHTAASSDSFRSRIRVSRSSFSRLLSLFVSSSRFL